MVQEASVFGFAHQEKWELWRYAWNTLDTACRIFTATNSRRNNRDTWML